MIFLNRNFSSFVIVRHIRNLYLRTIRFYQTINYFYHHEQYSRYLLDRAAGCGNRPRIRIRLLPQDETRERRQRPNEGDCRTRAFRRNGIPQTAVQDRNDRFHRAGHLFRNPGLRARRAEQMGALRIPHRRLLLGPGRILRHENSHLRLGPNRRSRPKFAQPRTESRLPERCRDGACRRRARTLRHLALVHNPRPLRRRLGHRQTRHDDYHHAHIRNGCIDAGALRTCRRRYLHQGGRCGCRPGREGRGRNPGRRPTKSSYNCRQCG